MLHTSNTPDEVLEVSLKGDPVWRGTQRTTRFVRTPFIKFFFFNRLELLIAENYLHYSFTYSFALFTYLHTAGATVRGQPYCPQKWMVILAYMFPLCTHCYLVMVPPSTCVGPWEPCSGWFVQKSFGGRSSAAEAPTVTEGDRMCVGERKN